MQRQEEFISTIITKDAWVILVISSTFTHMIQYHRVKETRVYFWCSGLSWNIFSCLLSLAFSPLAFLVFPFFFFGLLYSSTTALRTKLASMSSSFIWGRQFLRNALVNASAAAPGWDCEKWQWATYWQVCKVFVPQTVWVYLHRLTVPLFQVFTDPRSLHTEPQYKKLNSVTLYIWTDLTELLIFLHDGTA